MENPALIWLVSLIVAAAACLAGLRAATWLRDFLQAERAGLAAEASLRQHLLGRWGAFASIRLPGRYERWLRGLLIRSGGREGELQVRLGLQLGGAALGLAAGLLALAAGMGLFPLALLVVLGPLAPLLPLLDRAKSRGKQILRAFPFQLDLLALGVEAGLDLSTALEKVVERGSAGPLRDEFSLLLRELRMGKSRREAMETLAGRTALSPIERFVRSVIQAERMGIALGATLKGLAAELRDERFLHAEKLAAEAPVKMLFPLLFFIFPCVFLILFGPIVFAIL